MTIENVAKTFVINASGKVLLLRRVSTDAVRPGEWDLPGGGVEPGESYVNAAIREAFEEAHITLQPERTQLIYAVTRLATDGRKSVNRFVFATVLAEDQTPTLSHEHQEYMWVPIGEVAQVFPHPVYAVALQYAIEHQLIDF